MSKMRCSLPKKMDKEKPSDRILKFKKPLASPRSNHSAISAIQASATAYLADMQQPDIFETSDFEKQFVDICYGYTELYYENYVNSSTPEEVINQIAGEIQRELTFNGLYKSPDAKITKRISQGIQTSLEIINTINFNVIIAAEVEANFDKFFNALSLEALKVQNVFEVVDQRLKNFAQTLYQSLMIIANPSIKEFSFSQNLPYEYLLKSNYGKTHLVFSNGKVPQKDTSQVITLEVVEGMVKYFFMQNLKDWEKTENIEALRKKSDYSWIPYSYLCLAEVIEVSENSLLARKENKSETYFVSLIGKNREYKKGDSILIQQPSKEERNLMLGRLLHNQQKNKVMRYLEAQLIGLV